MVIFQILLKIVVFFAGGAALAQPVLCLQAFQQEIAPRDNFRAYAVGVRDPEGVQRVHVVDFLAPTLQIRFHRDDLIDVVFQRESFNDRDFRRDDVASTFDLFVPRTPMQTRAEFDRATSALTHRAFIRAINHGIYRVGSRLDRPPQGFEYEPSRSSPMLFLLELRTPSGIVELTFARFTTARFQNMEAISYGLHVARKLGISVESVMSVKVFGVGFD